MSQEWARKVWARLRDGGGISSRVRFHDMRHTFASILISNGASPVELAEPAGRLGSGRDVHLRVSVRESRVRGQAPSDSGGFQHPRAERGPPQRLRNRQATDKLLPCC